MRGRCARSGCVLVLLALMGASAADAAIVRIEITERESPTFGGYAFVGVGPYEKLVGRAYGELDPNDRRNRVIVDLDRAPRNAGGKVEYSFDFYMLKPMDLSRGNHKVMYEPPNRGRKLTLPFLSRGLAGADPGDVVAADVLAATFLLPQGYTLVWSGWDASAARLTADHNMGIALPVARNTDGTSITGPSYEYIVSQAARYGLTYPAATLDKQRARLTHRVHLDDQPEPLPEAEWTYESDGTAISLLPAGRRFVANDIYEFTYLAKDPTVNGIGLAAVRDFNAFLRYESQDARGTPNPLAGDVTRMYTVATSQPARMLNDFRLLGFNEAKNGRIVFDGMLQWVAAGDGINMNLRFSQPDRTQRNRQDQLYVEGVFPFANQAVFDPITKSTAGRYDACMRTSTCPLALEALSSNEYWVKGASLMHTDPVATRDLPEHEMSRLYLFSSHEHAFPQDATTRGACQQVGNPLDPGPVLRALWVALDAWVTRGVDPPPSRVPRLRDGTLVPPLPQAGSGFPRIPGVVYTGLKSTRYRLDYGPDFYGTGVMLVNPPAVTTPMFDNPANGPIYPTFVPKTDVDGNEIAGIRLPDISVPLATYTGWSLRGGAHANDGCDTQGQMIRFARTGGERAASGDLRLSLEERYGSMAGYTSLVDRALRELVSARVLLTEDVAGERARLLRAAEAAGVQGAASAADVTAPR